MTMSFPEDSTSQLLSPASSSDIPAAITAVMSREPCMAEVYTDEASTAEHSQLLIIDPCTRYESLNYYHPLQMKLLWPRVRTLICGYKQKCFESSLTAFSMTETDAPLGCDLPSHGFNHVYCTRCEFSSEHTVFIIVLVWVTSLTIIISSSIHFPENFIIVIFFTPE